MATASLPGVFTANRDTASAISISELPVDGNNSTITGSIYFIIQDNKNLHHSNDNYEEKTYLVFYLLIGEVTQEEKKQFDLILTLDT